MSEAELKIGDRLALDRTRMAAERTLMAWVRTALSMISFGFTIYKFLQVIDDESTVAVLRPETPRNVGLTLTGLGTFALLVASAQYRQHTKAAGCRGAAQAVGPDLLRGVRVLALLGLLIFGSIPAECGALRLDGPVSASLRMKECMVTAQFPAAQCRTTPHPHH